ncbi:WD40-repeat-containing domain protein [Chlamydoabsidia padenii]|nr:WD40-repeat-containing domain protein [Chlamydoabsidia padenii]
MSNSSTDEQKQIQEEYQVWKKTAPVLYESVVSHNMTWPTLTCQWTPKLTRADGMTTQELLVGTHTSDQEMNHVQFLSVDLPQENQDKKARMYLTQGIEHPGEVNRARYQPSNPDIFATKTRDGPLMLFDRLKSTPLLTLTGHSKEGYGMAWNPIKSNHLLSAGFDHLICHWDIGLASKDDHTLTPYQTYKAHTDCVEDVSWNAIQDSVFASVADDKKMMIWDTRTGTAPTQKVQAHNAEVNSVAFHPHQEWMIATGSSDKTIGLFDLRKLETPLYSMESHDGEVQQVAWSPHDDPLLASAASDRKIMIWDLRKIGEEQSAEDAEDGPPELVFVHNGHTSKITDFSWNPLEPWMMASAAEDNVVQVWQVSRNIYRNKDSIEVNVNDLE